MAVRNSRRTCSCCFISGSSAANSDFRYRLFSHYDKYLAPSGPEDGPVAINHSLSIYRVLALVNMNTFCLFVSVCLFLFVCLIVCLFVSVCLFLFVCVFVLSVLFVWLFYFVLFCSTLFLVIVRRSVYIIGFPG